MNDIRKLEVIITVGMFNGRYEVCCIPASCFSEGRNWVLIVKRNK